MKWTLLFVVMCFLWLPVCAQENKLRVVKYESLGYPPAAQATGTKGEVIVKVKINKQGKVVSAKVVSGHPLLRAISVKAAKEWVFIAVTDDNERETALTFAYFIKVNDDRKNNFKDTKIKIRFKKPLRLEITATMFPRIST